MKIKKVIEYLKQYNPEATLKLHHPDGEEVLFVCAMKHNKDVVFLETESDSDIKNELSERFANAMDEYIDEVDFYNDLINTGITVEMVCKYMGEETANHMQKFCAEHGLI